jgi:large subunit ribosomal protein L28
MSVSHSHRRTRRRWNPNIQTVHALTGPSGKTPKKLGVCTSCLKAGKVVAPSLRGHGPEPSRPLPDIAREGSVASCR